MKHQKFKIYVTEIEHGRFDVLMQNPETFEWAKLGRFVKSFERFGLFKAFMASGNTYDEIGYMASRVDAISAICYNIGDFTIEN